MDAMSHPEISRSPGPTSSPGTSPTAATSPASTATSTPAARQLVGTENFADRSELGTEECFRVIDDIAAFAPECLTILTGVSRSCGATSSRSSGARRSASSGSSSAPTACASPRTWPRRLAEAGARGLSLSLDALDPDRHDRFRRVRGAWQNTVEGAEILNPPASPSSCRRPRARTIRGELDAIADFAHDRLAAKVWNLYFLVPTGRGQFVSDMTPAQYDEVLASLYRIQRKYDRRMLVNAKCAPHYIKTVLEITRSLAGAGPSNRSGQPGDEAVIPTTAAAIALLARVVADQDLLRRRRRVPGGDALHGDPAERGCHALPLPPGLRGVPSHASLADLWTSSELFAGIRRRSSLGGRCGECEMNAHCGGCRARAYGMTGDLMAEDPLCTHTPGRFAASPLLLARRGPGEGGTLHGPSGVSGPPVIEYGAESPPAIAWDDAAAERMKRIPVFVRGMVVRAVEDRAAGTAWTA
jgi:AdoMet-dependent heme synthase